MRFLMFLLGSFGIVLLTACGSSSLNDANQNSQLADSVTLSAPAAEKRIVMVTHTLGTDPFWPIVESGAMQAAQEKGVTVIHKHLTNEQIEGISMTEMNNARADLIYEEINSENPPDGLIVTLPGQENADAAAAAKAAGIPVIAINSGYDFAETIGVPFIGQDDYNAGQKAGQQIASDGKKHTLCLNQEAFNEALNMRCNGIATAVDKMTMIEVGNDIPVIIERTAAALNADPSIDSLMSLGPHVCYAATMAMQQSRDVYLSCFDFFPNKGFLSFLKAKIVEFLVMQEEYKQGKYGVEALVDIFEEDVAYESMLNRYLGSKIYLFNQADEIEEMYTPYMVE